MEWNWTKAISPSSQILCPCGFNHYIILGMELPYFSILVVQPIVLWMEKTLLLFPCGFSIWHNCPYQSDHSSMTNPPWPSASVSVGIQCVSTIMNSLDYSDSEESSCSSGSSSIDCPPNSALHPNSTDIGKRVIFTSGQDKKPRYGVLRYMGEPEFSEGIWCGVVLDQPNGKNNGSVHGIRYFTCESNYGMFVLVNKVQIDTSSRCSRSHPNSQPSSRASSVERNGLGSALSSSSRPSSASKSAQRLFHQLGTSSSLSSSSTTLGLSSKIGVSMQQDLVNRLSQPMKRTTPQQLHHSQQTGVSSGRRQPMKAFATKGTEEVSVKESRKPLMPFRPGGMYKASSSENIRSMKDKEKVGSGGSHKVNQGMPSKKSSSERDLRNSGKSVGVGSKSNTSSSSTAKPKRKQMRTNSCSDVLAGGSSALSTSRTDLDVNLSSRKLSCDNHAYMDNYSWPRTSTPGNRDELTPDGCSSPEETDDAISNGKTAALSNGPHNNGFVETPQESSLPVANGGGGGGGGLATHVKQFAESELSSPSLPHLGVQSPEGNQAFSKQYYRNRPSGTATLSHPLTNSLITDGAHLLKQLLGPNQSVRHCTCTYARLPLHPPLFLPSHSDLSFLPPFFSMLSLSLCSSFLSFLSSFSVVGRCVYGEFDNAVWPASPTVAVYCGWVTCDICI